MTGFLTMSNKGATKGERAATWKWKSIAAATRQAFCSGLIRVKEKEGEDPKATMCMQGAREGGRHSGNALSAYIT